MPDRLERFTGCLLGLAAGDALGTTLEFTRPGGFVPLKDMVGGGPFRLEAGQWTDDTSMALCLAESLVLKNGFDPRDQMERYTRWAREGYLSSNGTCFDIGGTVASALSRYGSTGKALAGSARAETAGNGSIMRLAPVPMFYGTDPERAVHYSEESSKTTHGSESCLDACRYLGGLIWAALNGVEKEEMLGLDFSPAGDRKFTAESKEVAEISGGSFKRRNPPEIRGTGYVVRSLEAALWAFYRSDSFEEGCLLAVNLGEDADTTGAVYGQLAGAFYGRSAIPERWLAKLAQLKLIESLALSLAAGALKAED